MTEIPDTLRSLFSATVTERGGSYVVDVPKSEVEHDAVVPGETYRVALFRTAQADSSSNDEGSRERRGSERSDGGGPDQDPPVEEGEICEVTVETTGDQGDGIAKVDRGYVVIVPDGEPGETVSVEIDTVRPNVAFATLLESGRRD